MDKEDASCRKATDGAHTGQKGEQEKVQWTKQMPVAEKPQMESIIDKRISRKTRRKEYFEYLVMWKGHPVEDASWEDEE